MSKENTAPCPGCGAVFSADAGPTHAYLNAAPACWAAYGEVLAREYESPVLFGRAHRFTVDAYALQHPGNGDPRAARSVVLHFCAAHLVFAHGGDHDQANRLMQALSKADLPAPPQPPAFEMTVKALHAATVDEHAEVSIAWGETSWRAWRPALNDAAERLIAASGR